MQPQTFSQLRTKFDLRLNDTSNQIYASNLKDEFVYEALTDNYCYIVDKDDTSTTVFLQEVYPVPNQFTDVIDIALNTNNDGYFHSIDPSAYDVINGNIHFRPPYNGIIGGLTMRIVGKRPLGSSDTYPVWLQEYIMQLSLRNAYDYLTTKLADNFLTNDITMAEVLNKLARCDVRIEQLRATLANKYSQRI